ncbi:MAG: hypothetical protein ACK5RL_08930 [Acidimicrobiales bacterium]
MHTTSDPTMMLGRYSQIVTASGVINGTILAVGSKGISVAVDRQVLRIAPSDIHGISAAV